MAPRRTARCPPATPGTSSTLVGRGRITSPTKPKNRGNTAKRINSTGPTWQCHNKRRRFCGGRGACTPARTVAANGETRHYYGPKTAAWARDFEQRIYLLLKLLFHGDGASVRCRRAHRVVPISTPASTSITCCLRHRCHSVPHINPCTKKSTALPVASSRAGYLVPPTGASGRGSGCRRSTSAPASPPATNRRRRFPTRSSGIGSPSSCSTHRQR